MALSWNAHRRGWTAPRIAALLWILGPAQFVLGMAIAQLGWTTPYSLQNNLISDLGAVHCAYTTTAPIRWVCSPWHEVFDASAVLLGLTFIAGALLVRPAFPKSRSGSLGLAMIVLAGIGAMGVGLSPEDVNLRVHTFSATIAFLVGNSALLVLGAAMLMNIRWRRLGGMSIVLGIFGLGALGVFVSDRWGWIGVGGWERLVITPLLIWGVVVGARLLGGPLAPVAEELPAPAEGSAA